MTTGRLTTPADVNIFMFAGNATLTLKSLKTGERFTYKVKESDDGKVFFVNLLDGPDNTGDFTYLGHFRDGIYSHGRKSRIAETAPSARAFAFLAKQIRGLELHPLLEVWHEGRCGACNRKLTVPESIANGIGPECAQKRGILQRIVCEDTAREWNVPSFLLGRSA